MKKQDKIDYNRIAEAIAHIDSNFKSQPNLDQVAEKVHISPTHFQQMFTEWAGTSPKKILQYISIAHAKKILKEEQATLFDMAFETETGLSSTSRLHDLFVKIEGMTPGEYRNGGKNLQINYSFAESPFGNLIVASTPKGICSMEFMDDEKRVLHCLKEKFPNASFQRRLGLMQQNALFIFQSDWSKLHEVKLHLKGTNFQLKVWENLLKIPITGILPREWGQSKCIKGGRFCNWEKSCCYLIPFHLVIQSTGNIGDYMWGTVQKTAIRGWEAAKTAAYG